MAHRLVPLSAALLSLALLVPTGPAQDQAPAQPQPVRLRVLVPMANAEVTIEGQLTRTTGTTRTFVSPPVAAGRGYSYTVTATWRPNNYTTITRTREVPVRAGQEVEADLREADEKQPDKIVIRYVPTPQEVVDAMLRLAGVGPDDIVFDLGCGDGRIVVTAVQKFRAKRGVGVDLDPERIKESKANAKQHQVDDRVEFRQGDVMEVKDLSSATVVALYLSDELNLQLRPILKKNLKPGSRIVSHRFIMGDWKPDETQTITVRGVKYNIHLWKVGEADGTK